MTREEILSHVDHTLLKPEATWPQIQTLCDEAIANHTASVCINTCYVKQAVEYMAGRIPVCCVVGFPLGAMDTKSKAFEAKTAIENGAAEVDMVINIGRLKNKEYDAVREDIRAVKEAVGDKILKVIIETCLLTDEEKEKFYVNLTLTYTGREYYEEDYIIFLRNDNVYEGDLYDGDDTIGLSPGIYRVISSKAEGGRGAALGDIYLLTPGEDVTLNVDYTSSKATIINDENTK